MKYQAASDAADARARYVFVIRDGEVRELNDAECEYLATAFDPADGDRPYIKSSYEARTPDSDSMHGFLERKLLPRGIVVEPWSRPLPDPRIGEARGRRKGRIRLLLSLAAALALGWLAIVPGRDIAAGFMRSLPPLIAPGLVLLGLLLGTGCSFLLAAHSLWGAERPRLFRFFAVTAIWLGLVIGAVWALWLHGDPSRVLPRSH